MIFYMKIGILGSGLIVSEFAKGAAEVPNIEISSICGRIQSEEKVRALAKNLNIPRVFFDRSAFLHDSEIDTVYVALPNHLHASAALDAIRAEKHVIVEKPFTASAAQAQAVFREAEQHGVFVFEAAASVYLPAVKQAKEWLSHLGKIKLVQINYSQYSRRYERFKNGELPPVFDPNQAGGALMDLGVYNVHFALSLFGEPQEAHYTANTERGIDTSGTLVLRYPQFYCVLTAAKDCAAPCSISVQGDGGYIFSPNPANTITAVQLCKNGEEPIAFESEKKDRMAFELFEFERIVREGDTKAYEQAKMQTVCAMKILEERFSAGVAKGAAAETTEIPIGT